MTIHHRPARVRSRAGGPIYRAGLSGPRRRSDADPGDVLDLAGQLPSGVRQGAAAWADGPDGGPALRFDGPADFVAVPGVPRLATAATLMVRLRRDAATPVDLDRTGLIQLNGATDRTHYPYVNGLGYFSTFRGVARVDAVALSPDVDRTAWHWLAITTEAGGEYRVYQDHHLIHAVAAEPTVDVGATSNHPFEIGRSDALFGFGGAIAAVRVYDRALSHAEIAAVVAGREARPGRAPLARLAAMTPPPASGRLILRPGSGRLRLRAPLA